MNQIIKELFNYPHVSISVEDIAKLDLIVDNEQFLGILQRHTNKFILNTIIRICKYCIESRKESDLLKPRLEFAGKKTDNAKKNQIQY